MDQGSSGFEECLGHETAAPTSASVSVQDNAVTDDGAHTRRPVGVTSQSVKDDVIRVKEKHRRSVDSDLRRQHELDKCELVFLKVFFCYLLSPFTF